MSESVTGIIEHCITSLKKITAPYAIGPEHVQGPGGNTSVKNDIGYMLIKASGYLFADIVNNNSGVVLLATDSVLMDILAKVLKPTEYIITTAKKGSLPDSDNCKPSMEYEFHSLLGKYVLHTHSVYANVINCCTDNGTLITKSLAGIDYLVVPYVTPGYPIASFLYNYQKEHASIPSVIFLTNHGIIIHGNTPDDIIKQYDLVQSKICEQLSLDKLHDVKLTEHDNYFSANFDQFYGTFDVKNAINNLEKSILFPDQTIFFKNKISDKTDTDKPIVIDPINKQIIIKGSKRFAEACTQMIQAVQYVRENHKRLELTSVYLQDSEIDVLHGLSSEKHRSELLNKK